MNIFGIGTDIVSIDRIKNSLRNKNFINRIFNEKEILRCKKINNSINCYAKRFAAKEAFSKALGTGISNGINFNEIIILNKKSGKPYINVIGQTKKILKKKFKRRKSKISLSLSDEKKYAVAFVTISL
jgi:holo-[acyl-carrier protein] synthase